MSLASNEIALNEQKARTKYLAAVQDIADSPLSSGSNDFLEENILPLLVRIGFDREIADSLFRISAPAWKSVGPVNDPKLRLHTTLTRDIQKIRKDIVYQNEKEPRHLTFPDETSPREFANIAKKAMHPDTLSEQLQTIPTTWIILPRAHSFLTINDSHCLIVYLQHLDRETNLAFETILARILIEFIGNYSLKFISPSLPKKKMVEAIFYGYTAMFWKNLRQPPMGLEDLLIFRNYLSWAKAFKKRAASKDTEKEVVIAEMEKMQNDILPDQNIRTLARRKNKDASGLHITLRHGRPGINHAVRYFTMNSTSSHGRSHDHMAYKTLPKQINTLFRELRSSYDHETPRTREFIHAFLMELGTTYSQRAPRPNLSGQNIPLDQAFAHRRMSSMVKDFNQSLH